MNDTQKLRSLGLVLMAPTSAEYGQAVQAHIDATASDRGYGNGVACASYHASANAAWAAEASAFIAWRDAVWAYAFDELAKVQQGQRAQPSVAELVAELPTIAWAS